jgi:hypothetical protein
MLENPVFFLSEFKRCAAALIPYLAGRPEVYLTSKNSR